MGNTKEQIIETALALFSEKGYDAVSVRDIAREVGIRESSLYYHFKNKQDIFDTIVEYCFGKAEEYFRGHGLPFAKEDDISMYFNAEPDRLEKLLLSTFQYFFEDPWNIRFRKLLTVNQYENQRAKEIYRSLYRDYPLRFQSRLFAVLMEQGEFQKTDPGTAALEFYGPVFMLIHTCDSMEEAKEAMGNHIRQFIRQYRRVREDIRQEENK